MAQHKEEVDSLHQNCNDPRQTLTSPKQQSSCLSTSHPFQRNPQKIYEYFISCMNSLQERQSDKALSFQNLGGIRNNTQLTYVNKQLKDFEHLDKMVLFIRLLGQP